MSLNLMQIHKIHVLSEDFTQSEIAEILGISQGTVSNVLKGKTGGKQREIADRMEYFFGGTVPDSGCYRTAPCPTDNGETLYQEHQEIVTGDPVLDELIFMEELEDRY